MRRGILGGTFDPPHIAHLVAAECAYRQLGLEHVTLVPAGSPWQKTERGVSEAHHRLAMTRLACAGVEYFTVDDREVDRSGATFTIDTIESFPNDEVVLVMGADAAAGLDSWHRADELRRRASFAVMRRSGVETEVVDAATRPAPLVWLDAPEMAVSSTELRARAAAGASIRFLVADPVWRYVEANRLYSAS